MITTEWLDRPIAKIRPVALTRFLNWMHLDAIDVFISAQAVFRVSYVITTGTVVAAPDATLREVLIACMICSVPEARSAVGEPSRTLLPKAKLIGRVQDRLARDYPGFVKLENVLPLARSLDVRLSSARAKDVHEQLVDRMSTGPSHWQHAGTRWILSDCKLAGIADPLAELTNRIRAGEVPLATLPDFPDAPFFVAEIHLNRHTRHRATPGELERAGVVPDLVARIARCMRQTAEGFEKVTPPELSTHVGIDLRQDRLADARAALRSGQSFPVFTETAEPLHRFDPERYIGGVYFDLDGLAHSGKFATRTNPRFVASLLRAYQELGIHTFARAHVDRLVQAKGRTVLLRLEFILQQGDEPWSDSLWEGIRKVLDYTPTIPGELGHFTPLSFARMATEFRALVKPETDQSLLLLMTEGLYREDRSHVTNADERFAAALDRMAARLHQKIAPFSSTAFLLPKSLVEKLDKGGHIRPGCFGNE